MALLKKKKDAGGTSSGGADTAPAPKSGGKLLAILAPLVAFGAAFGASWIGGPDPSAQPVMVESEAKTEIVAPKAEWSPERPPVTVSLDPLTITAGSQGQTLRIGLAVEVWNEDIEMDVPRLRDAFTAYLRALDPAQLSDPSFHMRMKRALLHRARIVMGHDAVADVLVTDFLLTS